jgi:hypothetical protein
MSRRKRLKIWIVFKMIGGIPVQPVSRWDKGNQIRGGITIRLYLGAAEETEVFVHSCNY